ncbi:MAG: response regulator [Deltaproteobacteria bacterium]|nr:response regulator [Deltaproteobacteria bacterium]
MEPINVLLIDDEEAFVTTLAERMELRGFVPRVALNGQAGLDLIEAEKPDIVILDLRMPGMSGAEVLRHIQARWSDLPVIILSGHGSEQDLAMCMDLGASLFLSKPLEIDTLLSSIKSVLKRD